MVPKIPIQLNFTAFTETIDARLFESKLEIRYVCVLQDKKNPISSILITGVFTTRTRTNHEFFIEIRNSGRQLAKISWHLNSLHWHRVRHDSYYDTA